MRLLRNVIKQSEYLSVQPYSHENNSVSSIHEESLSRENESHLAVELAFEKAQKIIDAANQYCMNHRQEVMERLNNEGVIIREKSKSAGYQEGLQEGQKVGREIGYKEGYEEGLYIALEQNKKLAGNLYQAFEDLVNVKEKVIRNQEEDMVDLAVNIAELILKKELEMSRDTITSIIMDALTTYQSKEWIHVYISKNIYDEINQSNSDFSNELQALSKGIRLIPSIELDDSDCLIDLPTQVVDVSMDTQMSKIKAVLKR